MQSPFLEERGPKVFTCIFNGADPKDLISIATDNLAQIKDGITGKADWSVARKIQPLQGVRNGYFVLHTATFKVAKFSAVVALTLSAFPLDQSSGEEVRTPRLPVAGGMPTQNRPFHQRPPRDVPSLQSVPYASQLTAHFEGGGWDY